MKIRVLVTKPAALMRLAILAAASAQAGLTIVPNFVNTANGTWTQPLKDTVNASLATYNSGITDNLTIPADFKFGPAAGGATSSKLVYTITYTAYRTALGLTPPTPNDTDAQTAIGNTATDPVIGGANIRVAEALMFKFGLILGPNVAGTYGTVTFGQSFLSNPAGFLGVSQHEVNELLGTSSNLPNGGNAGVNPTVIQPADLFRYDTLASGGSRTFDVNFASNPANKAYFKLSAFSTALEGWHNLPDGGDYGDWAALGEFPAAPQDYTGNPAVFTGMVGSSLPTAPFTPGASNSELVLLDVVGWNGATAPVPEVTGFASLAPLALGALLFWRGKRAGK